MSEARTERVASFDGTEIAVHRLGQGRPVLLLHGLFSSADMNWTRFGHAQTLADAGFEAIMPDLRAHGESDAPHEPGAYPADVLVRDVLALVEALDLSGFDLVGFSLGARTAARACTARSSSVKPGARWCASDDELGSIGVTATSRIVKASGAVKRSPSPEVQPSTRLMSPRSLRSGIRSMVAASAPAPQLDRRAWLLLL